MHDIMHDIMHVRINIILYYTTLNYTIPLDVGDEHYAI